MFTLSKSQLSAIECFASDLSQKETSAATGVSTRTLNRWAKLPAFQEELEKRKALKLAGDRIDQAKQAIQEGMTTSDLESEIRKLGEMKKKTRDRLHSAGSFMLSKAFRRFQDLPEEAIAPSMIVPLMDLALRLISNSEAAAAESLAINELLNHLMEQESVNDE